MNNLSRDSNVPNNDEHFQVAQKRGKRLIIDLTCGTIVPWLIAIFVFAVFFYMTIMNLIYTNPTCNGAWNEVTYDWKLSNCSIYGDESNDSWRLCNMFINVNKMHSSKYNWFSNPNTSSVCDWDYISCNNNDRIDKIELGNRVDEICADINISYIPSQLVTLNLYNSKIGFYWNSSLFPSTIKYIYLNYNFIYGDTITFDNFPLLKEFHMLYNGNFDLVDFLSAKNINFDIIDIDEDIRCNISYYCPSSDYSLTQRIYSRCYNSFDDCFSKCGYCTPKTVRTWNPSMVDLTSMFVLLFGCGVVAFGTCIGTLYGWCYQSVINISSHIYNFDSQLSIIGIGAIGTSTGLIGILWGYTLIVVYGNPWVVGSITWFVAVTTVGWGAMEYGFFYIEEKLGLLKRVAIPIVFHDKLIHDKRFGKLYWFDYQPQGSEMRVYYKVGKMPCICCYGDCNTCACCCCCNYDYKCCLGYQVLVRGPGYIDYRFLLGVLFGTIAAGLIVAWWAIRNSVITFGSNYEYEPYHMLILMFIIFAPAMATSKFALAHVLLFMIIFMILSQFENDLFSLPYYDYVGIAIIGPTSLAPLDVWTCIFWSMPTLYISFRFSSKKIVKSSASIIISNLTSVFDIITDILVIYTWALDNNIGWAMCQLSFVLMNHIYAALMIYRDHKKNINICIRNNGNNENNNNNMYKYDKTECTLWTEIVLTLIGAGKLWFGAKTLKIRSEINYFKKLKIWEIIFESFPTVCLAYYAALQADALYTPSVLLSLFASFINISMTVMLIMFRDRTLSHNQMANANANDNYNYNQDKVNDKIIINYNDQLNSINTTTSSISNAASVQLGVDQENSGNKYFNAMIKLPSWRGEAPNHGNALTLEQQMAHELQLHGVPKMNREQSSAADFNRFRCKDIGKMYSLRCCCLIKDAKDTTNNDNTNDNKLNTVESLDKLFSIDAKTGEITFKYEIPYNRKYHGRMKINKMKSVSNRNRSASNSNSNEKNNNKSNRSKVSCCCCKCMPDMVAKWVLEKIDIFCNMRAFKAIAFFVLVWLFICCDLFLRVSPSIILYITLNNNTTLPLWLNNGIMFIVIGVILLVQTKIVYDINKENWREYINIKFWQKIEFIMIFSGLITNGYFFWNAIGLDYLPYAVNFNIFLKEQKTRLAISTTIEIVAVIIQVIAGDFRFPLSVSLFFVALLYHFVFSYKLRVLYAQGLHEAQMQETMEKIFTGNDDQRELSAFKDRVASFYI